MSTHEYDVFLSYNGKDEAAVEELARRLRDGLGCGCSALRGRFPRASSGWGS